MTLIAHGGHWAVNLLYITPVIIVALAVLIERRRERPDPESAADITPQAVDGS